MPATAAGPAAAGLFLGLISGTSADGIDAALVRFDDPAPIRTANSCSAAPTRGRTRCARAWSHSARAATRARWTNSARSTCRSPGLRRRRARRCSTRPASTPPQVRAIGSHGQTVRHRPEGARYDGRIPSPGSSATATSSPSAPASPPSPTSAAATSPPAARARRWCRPSTPPCCTTPDEDRAVLNLGGIANFTLLPAHGDVRGFDTGPANALMDAWCERHRGDAVRCAAAPSPPAAASMRRCCARLLDEPWFALPPPKSTGREQFHLGLGAGAPARRRTRRGRAGDAARTQRRDRRRCAARAPAAHAPRARLRRRRAQRAAAGAHRRAIARTCVVESTAAHGLDPDFVEAMALRLAGAARRWPAVPGNLPSGHRRARAARARRGLSRPADACRRRCRRAVQVELAASRGGAS